MKKFKIKYLTNAKLFLCFSDNVSTNWGIPIQFWCLKNWNFS